MAWGILWLCFIVPRFSLIGITVATKTKQYTDINAVNELNLVEAMGKLKSYDPSLTDLNLNNHKEVTEDILMAVAENLRDNQHLKTLYLANTQMTDAACKVKHSESVKFERL